MRRSSSGVTTSASLSRCAHSSNGRFEVMSKSSVALADLILFARFGEVLDELMGFAVEDLVAALHGEQRVGNVALARAEKTGE